MLLPLECFKHIFLPLRDRRVVIVDGIGNPGDHMIYAATRQLLNRFGICWTDVMGPADICLLFGGGNLGSIYEAEEEIRIQAVREARQHGITEMIVLPQSAMWACDLSAYSRVYARELASLRLLPGSVLAPDLSLGYEYESQIPEPTEDTIIYLRGDAEQCGQATEGDFNVMAFQDYFALAGSYRTIITNRLHFAICGLICKR